MSYRTILVHVDGSSNAAARIALAAGLADDAHLVGLAMAGVPRYMLAGGPFGTSGSFIADYLAQAQQKADAALAQFDQIAERAGVQSRERRRSEDDDYNGLCLQARYADLVVLGQNAGQEGSKLLQDLPEYVILNCGRPVLLAPEQSPASIGKRALIAWNGSVQAAKAVSAALPLLRRSGKAVVAVFDPKVGSSSGHGEEPGADIALYLARHGVEVEVQVRPHAPDTGHALLSLASDLDADLLVMGAYGHSRFREVMLGGATRTVLATARLPVLMMH